MATKAEKEELIEKKLKPAIDVAAEKDTSGFMVADKFFNKEKSYIDPKTKVAKTVSASWRNLHIGGVAICAHKGVPLSKEQLAAFDKDAKKYYLVPFKA